MPSVLVSLKNVSLSLPGQDLLGSVSFSVERGQLLALVGANGCGKSTILRKIFSCGAGGGDSIDEAGLDISGQVVVTPGTVAAYLPQDVRSSQKGVGLADQTDRELIGREGRLKHRFGLGDNLSEDMRVSDGELQKRAIIGLLIKDADLYLFDEPTNYLDIDGITAFEDSVVDLLDRGKGVILVSHDRALTDNLASETILLSAHGIYRADGGASAVWAVYDSEYESRRTQAKDIEKKIGKLQADARKKAGWSATSEKRKIGAGSSKPYLGKLSKKMAKRAKVMQRRITKETERLQDTKPFVPKKVSLQFPDYEIRKLNVFTLSDVTFDYDAQTVRDSFTTPRPLLEDVTLSADTGDKLCLMGANGAGKSTILKIIQKQLVPVQGTAYLNESVRVTCIPQGLEGYFEKPILIDNFGSVGFEQSVIRQYLGSVLLRGDKVNQPVENLSCGELMRAALVRCILERAEFLLLDEPTSHLDIESVAVLEQLLTRFRGGFLMISHDRSFVAATAERLYYIGDGKLRLL